MIRITTPFEIGNGVNHITQANAITKSLQPLTCILSVVALWLDTGDYPASGCDLQLLAGLNSLEVGGKVLPQIGYEDADHARHTPLYKANVHIQADARQDDRLICSSKAASLAAFCSSPFNLSRFDWKLSARRRHGLRQPPSRSG
jgi:hypothetical protein